MNDPFPPSLSPPASPGDAPAESRGSLAIGFGTGCLVLILGPLLSGLLLYAVTMLFNAGGMRSVGAGLGTLASLIPLGLLVGAIVFFLQKGQSRSALGVLAAFLAMIALCLLLVAACFGMFAMSGSGWH